MIIDSGAVSQSILIRIFDDSGLPVSGLNAAGLPTMKYGIAGANAPVTITPSDLASATAGYSSGGLWSHGDGVYRFDLPNAIFASAGRVLIWGEAAGKRVVADTIDVAPPVNVTKVAGTLQTARDLGGNLDVAVSSRSTFAGGAVASVTAPVATTSDGSISSILTSSSTAATQASAAAASAATAASQTAAAAIRAVLGMTAADLDAQLDAILAASGGGGGGGGSFTADDRTKLEGLFAVKPANTPLIDVSGRVDLRDAPNATALAAIATAGLDLVDGVETAWTQRQALRLILAALIGKVSGADGSTVVFRNPGDTKNRISATVDASGNRTAVTVDKT
jgi:hypothetical protein